MDATPARAELIRHALLGFPEKGSNGMIQKPYSARVVAQLRYEYALNLVQRLGGTLTRIGLDYV